MVLSTLYEIISGIKNHKRLSHGIWLSPDLSTRADNGRGLIKRAINKICLSRTQIHCLLSFIKRNHRLFINRSHVGRCLNTIFEIIMVAVIGSSATERTNALDV